VGGQAPPEKSGGAWSCSDSAASP